ncbi:CPXCG motif-containing cysteine-rich protein [Flavivirga rizhaonensis]|uniref:CPXCG motif-containing cysteine-rich protein n=1 Tax=Flavivirga rizhaonensis TaxID=2559571 RepID=A0A4S1E158_9FLAO|nr:CPXCG motif-containing cysteine-rich protein [Flavivirga rizhaonensis]
MPILIDNSIFQQSYIEDCEVYCCNPYSIIS